jgi:hypothetical protein
MSHSLTLNRQVEVHHAAMEIHAFPVEPIPPLPGGELPSLAQLRGQIQDQRKVRTNSAGGGLISRSHQHRIQPPAGHLIGFGRKRKPV